MAVNYVRRTGERVSSRTSSRSVCGMECTFFNSYSESLTDDSTWLSICSVVTLICGRASSVRLISAEGS